MTPIVSWTVSNDQLQPGAIGVDASSFAVIIPGAEWSIQVLPPNDNLGAVLGTITPLIWVIGDPLQGFSVKLIPILGGASLRIVAPDLITPLPGAAFVCGARLFRTGPTS